MFVCTGIGENWSSTSLVESGNWQVQIYPNGGAIFILQVIQYFSCYLRYYLFLIGNQFLFILTVCPRVGSFLGETIQVWKFLAKMSSVPSEYSGWNNSSETRRNVALCRSPLKFNLLGLVPHNIQNGRLCLYLSDRSTTVMTNIENLTEAAQTLIVRTKNPRTAVSVGQIRTQLLSLDDWLNGIQIYSEVRSIELFWILSTYWMIVQTILWPTKFSADPLLHLLLRIQSLYKPLTYNETGFRPNHSVKGVDHQIWPSDGKPFIISQGKTVNRNSSIWVKINPKFERHWAYIFSQI